MADSNFPRPSAEGWPLVFLHIPKCSGTSFENYLATFLHFKGRSSCFTGVSPHGHIENFTDFVNRNTSTPFIYGHVKFSQYEKFFPHALILTFLRDPVQRTISQYKSWHDPRNFREDNHHFIKATQEAKDALKFSQKATLEEFVKGDNRFIKNYALQNIQTSMLSSCTDVSWDIHLESAKANLAKCIFFGLTEYFNESIAVFRSLFTDAPDYTIKPSQENRSRTKLNDISPKILEMIQEHIAHDISLYEYAQNIFRERNHPQFAREKAYLLFDILPENNQLAPEFDLKAFGDTMGALSSEIKRLYFENQLLIKRVEELTDIYESIVQSKGWRFIEKFRSAKRWLYKK